MKNNNELIINRLHQLIGELKKRNQPVKSINQLFIKAGESASNASSYTNGRFTIGYAVLNKLCDTYNFNFDFLENGNLPMFQDELNQFEEPRTDYQPQNNSSLLQEKIRSQEVLIHTLQKMIEDKDKIIQLLETQISGSK